MSTRLKNIRHTVQDYVMILIGTIAYGFSFNAFILSNEIVTGGVSGICALIYFATDGLIPVSASYFVINAGLLAGALKILGWKFMVKTVFGVISLSGSLTFFEWLLEGKPLLAHEPFMAIMIGAIIIGASLGVVFSANGSTGGTDIIGAVVHKYKNISIGRILIYCDFVIISSSFLLFHDVDKIVFGFVEMVVCNLVLDMVLNSNRQSVQFLIFSKKHDEIAAAIISELGRGCTFLDGVGGYSHEPVKVVVLLARKSESAYVFRLVKRIDPQAFISQSVVRGVYGEGFDPLKT